MNCSSQEMSVFCELKESVLREVDDAKIVSHFKRGQTVFYQGNTAPGIYCINRGVVKIEKSGINGETHILRIIGPGGVLGYRSLFAEEPYAASAVVHEDADLCLIPKSALLALCKKNPELAMQFLSRLAKDTRQAEDRMCQLVDQEASERVAEALIFLKDHFEEQSWTRREISEWAGTTPETVMRTLANFEDEGLIAQHGRKIDIVNRKKLLAKIDLTSANMF